jgi:hypothetical protein
MPEVRKHIVASFSPSKFFPKQQLVIRCMSVKEGESFPLFVASGVANDFRLQDNKIDPAKEKQKVLIGCFKIVAEIDGVTHVADTGKLYLPSAAAEIVANALVDEDGEVRGSCGFQFLVLCRRKDAAATGYVFDIESLLDPTENETREISTLGQALRARGDQKLLPFDNEAVVE